MKRLKRIIRLWGLILFMILAVAGIGIIGVAPTLTKSRKLFADIKSKTEVTQKNSLETDGSEKLKL